MNIRHLASSLILSAFVMTLTPLRATASEPEKTFSGISFYVLRVIYPQDAAGGVALNAYNKTDKSWLMQSWITEHDPLTGDVKKGHNASSAFVITPPLQRLDAGEELSLRIRRSTDALPKDKESVFFVSVKAIPSQPRQQEEPRLTVTVVSNLKLFYRPEGLVKRAVADMAPRLTFRQQNDQLLAENPTPYWLTFSRLKVGTYEVDKPALRLMVPPFSEQRYKIPPGKHAQVIWQLIDEDGWDTPELKRNL